MRAPVFSVACVLATVMSMAVANAQRTAPEANTTLYFAEEPPGYVFDTIPYFADGELHLFYLNAVHSDEGGKPGSNGAT